MPGNININSGGGVEYSKIEPKTIASSSGYLYGNNNNIFPNIYYEFGEVELINLTEKGHIDKTYEEYMFEFTALKDNVNLKIISEKNLYWPVTPEFVAGHKYQISELNGVVLFAEGEV